MTNSIIWSNETREQGCGIETEDILQMYRHLYFCTSFSFFISRFKPRWPSYSPPPCVPSSSSSPDSFPPPFLRHRLLIEGVPAVLFSSLIHQTPFPPHQIFRSTETGNRNASINSKDTLQLRSVQDEDKVLLGSVQDAVAWGKKVNLRRADSPPEKKKKLRLVCVYSLQPRRCVMKGSVFKQKRV